MGLFNRRKKNPSEPRPEPAAEEYVDETPFGTQYGGRELALPAPLEVASAPVLAQWFADLASENVEGMNLDYSVRSLEDVDAALSTFEQRGSERTAEVIVAAGFYAGEVFVRNYGFRWKGPEEDRLQDAYETPEALRYSICAPGTDGNSYIVNKAFKRVENGDEDSIAFFGRYLVAEHGSTAASSDS